MSGNEREAGQGGAAPGGKGPAVAEGPYLTVAVPCYDEEAILPATYARLKRILEAQGVSYELIFGNDGSNDRTLELIEGFAADDAKVFTTTHYPNRGLGYTYRDMYAAARGEIVITLDCDLAMTPEVTIPTFMDTLKQADVAIGSRYKGVKADYPLKRLIFSWGYIIMNRLLFNLKVLDTQTGTVGFHREVLPMLDLKADGPEMLVEFIAQVGALPLRVEEVPLPWVHDTTSGETPVWRTSAQMLAGTMKVRRRFGAFRRAHAHGTQAGAPGRQG